MNNLEFSTMLFHRPSRQSAVRREGSVRSWNRLCPGCWFSRTPARLQTALIWAGQNRAELRTMGLRGPSRYNSTHEAMHQKRHKLLHEVLGKGK